MCKNQGPVAHSPQCIFRNALFLSYMAYRGMVDHEQNPNAAKTAGRISELFKEDWMELVNPDATELRFVNAPFGSLTAGQCAEASWLIERMAVLAWAVGACELPLFHSKINGAKVSKALGIFQPGTCERIEAAKLRSPDEIVMGAETYSALQWRLSERASNPVRIDFYEKVKDPESNHLTIEGLEFCDNDLAIGGVPLCAVPEKDLGFTFAIVYQRFKGFRWLLGYDRGESTVTAVQ